MFGPISNENIWFGLFVGNRCSCYSEEYNGVKKFWTHGSSFNEINCNKCLHSSQTQKYFLMGVEIKHAKKKMADKEVISGLLMLTSLPNKWYVKSQDERLGLGMITQY